jgi:hypothetical protein
MPTSRGTVALLRMAILATTCLALAGCSVHSLLVLVNATGLELRVVYELDVSIARSMDCHPRVLADYDPDTVHERLTYSNATSPRTVDVVVPAGGGLVICDGINLDFDDEDFPLRSLRASSSDGSLSAIGAMLKHRFLDRSVSIREMSIH